ncbi:hypothetical protein UG54_00725 [Gordonia sihwensis]|nr:hypothetical protein UG54_00725 [Gordonia sihwensis]
MLALTTSPPARSRGTFESCGASPTSSASTTPTRAPSPLSRQKLHAMPGRTDLRGPPAVGNCAPPTDA